VAYRVFRAVLEGVLAFQIGEVIQRRYLLLRLPHCDGANLEETIKIIRVMVILAPINSLFQLGIALDFQEYHPMHLPLHRTKRLQSWLEMAGIHGRNVLWC
jgi:hypothetical protein